MNLYSKHIHEFKQQCFDYQPCSTHHSMPSEYRDKEDNVAVPSDNNSRLNEKTRRLSSIKHCEESEVLPYLEDN